MSKWEMVKFSDIFLDVTSKAKKIPKENYLIEGTYPIVDQGKSFIAGYNNDGFELFENTPVILFGDHTRIIKYIDFPLFIGADGVKLLKCTFKDVCYKYLYYTLTSVKIIDTGYNRHFKWLKESSIPLPPLETQKKIADELDKITSLIEKRKTQIEKLDLLVKAKFIEMFGDPVLNPMGWGMKKLGDLCKIYRGASPRPIDKFLNGTIPWIKIGDATKGDNIYISSTKEKVTLNGAEKSRLIRKGGLIFANCGVSLGFARILKIDGCIHDGWLAFENFEDQLNKIFFLKSLNYCTQYFRNIAPDGTQPNLNTGIMKDYAQILPPLDLQNNFERFVETTEKTKQDMQKGLEQLETLYKQRMQEYFE